MAQRNPSGRFPEISSANFRANGSANHSEPHAAHPENGVQAAPDRVIGAPFDGLRPSELASKANEFVETSGLEDERDYFLRGAVLAQNKTAWQTGGVTLLPRKKEEYYLCLESQTTGLARFKQSRPLYALVIVCSLGAAVQGWDEAAVSGAQIFYQYALDISTPDKGNILGLVNSAPYLCCAFSCWLNDPLNRWFGRRGTILITCLISSVTCLLQGFSNTWKVLFTFRFLLGFGIGPKSATIPVFAAECAPANVRGALVMMWQMWTAAGIMLGYIAAAVLRTVSHGDAGYCIPTIMNGTVELPTNMFNDTSPENVSTLLKASCSLNWRMMLASPMILPLVVVAYVYCLPESPRWLLKKAHIEEDRERKARDSGEEEACRKSNERKREYYEKAFASLCLLRHTKLQAARDLFHIHHLLLKEDEIMKQNNRFWELFSNGRNRRALTASVIVMFLQQFCGVNVLVYYSIYVLHTRAGFDTERSILVSAFAEAYRPYGQIMLTEVELGMGFGIINFVFALPAIWTIDTFGRRNLLLATFPFMAIFQVLISVALAIQHQSVQTVLLVVGMYLFAVAYSPGEGPVPFVYSAESMPLYNRDFGMGIVTSVLWLFNFVLGTLYIKNATADTLTDAAITVPQFISTFKPWGTFLWYAAWCVIGWWAILLFVPETKDRTLEELYDVFDKPTSKHIAHGMAQLKYAIRRHLLGNRRERPPELIERNDENGEQWYPIRMGRPHSFEMNTREAQQ